MSWHRAAAVLASVFVPMLATAAHAKPLHHHRHTAHVASHGETKYEHRAAYRFRSHRAHLGPLARGRHVAFSRWAKGRSARRLQGRELSTGSFDGGFSS